MSPGGLRREDGDGSSHSVQSSACSLLIPPVPELFPGETDGACGSGPVCLSPCRAVVDAVHRLDLILGNKSAYQEVFKPENISLRNKYVGDPRAQALAVWLPLFSRNPVTCGHAFSPLPSPSLPILWGSCWVPGRLTDPTGGVGGASLPSALGSPRGAGSLSAPRAPQAA